MTKDNWIKAFEKDIHEMLSHITFNMEKYRLNNYGHELPARPALDFMIKDLVKKYVSQVEHDTEKRKDEEWRKKIKKLEPDFVSELAREYPWTKVRALFFQKGYLQALSDLLKEKESA